MKKLFIAAMALAAMVSCSKETEDVALTSGKKAIAIEIANAKTATRADLTEGDTAAGEAKPCATFEELKVLFANNAGVIVENYDLSAGERMSGDNKNQNVYMFHGVDQSVTQVAVARWDATLDSDISIVNGTTNISTLLARSVDLEKNADRAVSQIALYGVDESLTETSNTHTGSPVTNNTHATDEETTYKVYTAEITVVPAFARIEITGISCTDLGDENSDGVADHVTGLDEMILNSFTFTNGQHNYSLEAIEKVKWDGSYKTATTTDGEKTWATTTTAVRSAAPEKGAWSWNVAPNSSWSPMTLNMTVDAADYKVQVTDRDLTIANLEYNGTETDPTAYGFAATTVEGATKYYLNTYKQNHIYNFAVVFSEKNLDEVNEDMCVQVTVKIVDWVVVPVKPVFGN